MANPTFISNRLAELPAELNGPEGRAWATGMGSVQDAQIRVARVAALSRLPMLCPDDALDLVGQWLLIPRYPGEITGTALPPTGYRGRLCSAFATWAIAGSSGAIIEQFHAYGIPEVTIEGDVNWENSWYTRFRVRLGPDFGTLGWTTAAPPTDEQKRQLRAIILKWKWAYSYPVDVVLELFPDDESFFIGPLIGEGFVIGVNGIGGYEPSPGNEIPVSPPTVYTPPAAFPDLSAQLLPENNDVLNFSQTWTNDVAIVSFTNATPIVVTTDPNVFQTGDSVTIFGTSVAAINKRWTVTRLSSSTFSLDTSTASGVGGAGGGAYQTYLGTLSRLIQACFQLAPNAAIPLSAGSQLITPIRPFQTYLIPVPVGAVTLSLATVSWPQPLLGTIVRLVRPATGSFAITIEREVNTGGNVVVLPSATWSSANIEYTTGGLWKLIDTSGGTPGADA